MGKTAQGAVWLNEDRLANFDYWQYWRNVDDADVGRFLRLFTELPLAEIERLEALAGAELNEAKKILAYEATKLCRREEAARAAAEAARAIYEVQSRDELGVALTEHATVLAVPHAEFENGISVVELFRRSGLVGSKGEARRLGTSSQSSCDGSISGGSSLPSRRPLNNSRRKPGASAERGLTLIVGSSTAPRML